MRNPISLGGWRPVITRQPSGISDVALTFDDGPTPDTTPHVLALLEKADAKATFFLSGVRIAAYPELVAAIVAAGHAVYGHAWEHKDLESARPSRAVNEMRRVEDALARFRSTPSPYLIRLPYNAGYNRSWMHRAMARFHPDVQFATFSLPTYDYTLADNCSDRATLEARCRNTAQKLCANPSLPGGVVLMHEKPFDVDAELAPLIAETLLAPVLAGIAARGLSIGPMRPITRHRVIDRFVMLKRVPASPVEVGAG